MYTGLLSKFGISIKKHWLVPAAAGLIELGIASYSLYGSLTQGRSPLEVYTEIHQTIKQDAHSIISKPLAFKFESGYKRDFKEGKIKINSEEIAKALEHPTTLRRLEEIIEKDKANKYTEIPFQVMLDYDKNNDPLFNFYEKPNTFNERNSIILQKHRDNPKFVLHFITREKEHFMSITGMNETAYNKSVSLLKGLVENEKTVEEVNNIKKTAARILADWYVRLSDNFCVTDEGTLKDFYWKNYGKFKGNFIGEGHIHLQSTESPEPSPRDFEASKRMRQFVFAETDKNIILYVLGKSSEP